MRHELLSAVNDAKRWDQLFAERPLYRDVRFHDVHFTSAYARIARLLGGDALAFVTDDEFKPFILRGNGEVASFYQYGGVVSTDFDMWARANGVISEYCCPHPVLQRFFLPSTDSKKQVVVIDLANFSKVTLSRRIRRALDNDVVWQVRDDGSERFWRLYERAAQRKSFSARWTRSAEYFCAYEKENVGALWFFGEGQDCERGLLTIGLGQIAYAHYLGGDYASSDVDAALYYNAALVLRSCGFRFFHLGGGVTDSDEDFLLFYKSGFSDLRWTAYRHLRVYETVDA